MTLVIAQKTENGILSLSDTKLSFADARSENPYFGALKSLIVGPQITFHFAGNIHWAEEALKKMDHGLSGLSHDDFADLVEMLLSLHIESTEETDFILADSQSSAICKISGGKSLDCERAYIGDPDAYRSFSEFLSIELQDLRESIEEKHLMSSALSLAFDRTLRDASLTSVDGLNVSIIQLGQDFAYPHKIALDIGPQKLTIGKGLTKIPFGNVANGSFSVNFVPSGPGEFPQVLGVHLHHGEIGILWGPGHYMKPIVLKDCTHDFLVAHAEKAFGATISGLKVN